MTATERKHIEAIIKYVKRPGEICYDEFAYKRMQNGYRGGRKSLLKHGHSKGKPNRRKGA